ncbi:MAG: hypothetical protein ACFFCW_06360 [Candidatus Hodarchaeota archaeon]
MPENETKEERLELWRQIAKFQQERKGEPTTTSHELPWVERIRKKAKKLRNPELDRSELPKPDKFELSKSDTSKSDTSKSDRSEVSKPDKQSYPDPKPDTEGEVCEVCRTPLKARVHPRGKPRRFCSDRCRKRASRAAARK